MKKTFKNILLALSALRLLPHLLLISKHDNYLHTDIIRWAGILFSEQAPQPQWLTFIKLMTYFHEFRNLYYYRLGFKARIFAWLCPPLPTLYIHCPNIGPGLFIQHGFATIIAAKSIGENCWINQQVTIGYSNNTDTPTISNNVSISAGAKVLGGVTIGENSKIGANAVVVKNVPANCTVVGVPAYIVKQDGVKIQKSL